LETLVESKLLTNKLKTQLRKLLTP
jgi:Ca2+-binding EF-hand superfamily protein